MFLNGIFVEVFTAVVGVLIAYGISLAISSCSRRWRNKSPEQPNYMELYVNFGKEMLSKMFGWRCETPIGRKWYLSKYADWEKFMKDNDCRLSYEDYLNVVMKGQELGGSFSDIGKEAACEGMANLRPVIKEVEKKDKVLDEKEVIEEVNVDVEEKKNK